MATTVSASDYLENALLDHVLRGVVYTPPSVVYVALFTAAPSDTGGGTEATGGSYARQPGSFGLAAASSAATDQAILFTALAAGTYTHLGVFDAATAGNLLLWGELDAPVEQAAGDDLEILAGDLTATFLAGAITDYLANQLLDHVLRSEAYTPPATVELALYDELDAEWVGGGYARQPITFGAAAAGSAASSAEVEFVNSPEGGLEYGVLHEDTAAGGAALWRVTPSAPTAVSAGSTVTVAAGGVTATMD